jgi:hypothetical protein
MNSFTVHVSDPSGFDEQAVVSLEDVTQLGTMVKMALDEMMEKRTGPMSFPVFVDVHPSTTFSGHAWMYQGKETKPAPTLATVGRN